MKGGLPHKSEQEAALREAQECLEAMKREGFQLDQVANLEGSSHQRFLGTLPRLG